MFSVALLILCVMFVSSCGEEASPYEKNDADGYNISVRYDANGGVFTTNTSVIVDSYSISELPVNENGEFEIALIAPDNESRGKNAFTPTKSGYFLAGWYRERTDNGDGTYTYAGRWDFDSETLKCPSNGEYMAQEPELTLYAAWVPQFEINYYSLGTGEFIDKYVYNPTTDNEIRLPEWNTETGKIEMYKFPTVDGYTYNGAYYDAEGESPVAGQTLAHVGSVNYETGTAENTAMNLYIDLMAGEWYNIYTAEQFIENASVGGCYIINADLDFDGLYWPTSFTQGNVTCQIIGNSHTFSNINVEQTNNSKVNVGLFGHLDEGCVIESVNFDNVTFTVKAGTRVAGTSYGLFAGIISGGTDISDVTIENSRLLIDSGAYFGTDDYSIGRVAGMGDYSGVTSYDITVDGAGDAPETVLITENGDEITVEIVNE